VSALRRWLREERARESAAIHETKVRTFREVERREPGLTFKAIAAFPQIVTRWEDDPAMDYRVPMRDLYPEIKMLRPVGAVWPTFLRNV
jgi:hypothetical protein